MFAYLRVLPFSQSCFAFGSLFFLFFFNRTDFFPQPTQHLDNLSLLVAAANTIEKEDNMKRLPQYRDQYNRHTTNTSPLHSPMELDDNSNDKREWSHKKYRPFHHSKPRTQLWIPSPGEPALKVTVTDVTCNCLRVTFFESPTDEGFFKSSMDT